MVAELPNVELDNQSSFRLVNSKFPTITLFDDVIDAEDFDTAYALQALTNPRILNQLGDLNLLPKEEIPFGINGVNYATAPFTHVNKDGSRFSDGSFGMLYLADTVETAIAETRYHQEKYFRNIKDLNYDTVDMRCLSVKFSACLCDASGVEEYHHPDDYSAARLLGASVMKRNYPGVQYSSVRNEGATCWGLMSPRYVSSAVQTQHFEFMFDGERITKVRELRIPS
ncbi:hypothetical protein BM525_18945 (plasmid) [Alteromonas mediterranea]|uniref:RES domain-containing protein n=1 Tax=Alteromonas mediterranea TaxID=314275 RepID=A0AAC9JGA9_9ALTE|nr:RES family NAD+ phosphorylase [Alteromonas mediterranea]APD91961.1 hypothetical protein BM524_18750 [Alteromonas mediterranea]APD99815.1 hypothetical protein BM525_18945 [Alteromonas mediterranea]